VHKLSWGEVEGKRLRRLTRLRIKHNAQTVFVLILIPVLSALTLLLETCRPQPIKLRPPDQTQISGAPDTSFFQEHANIGFPLRGSHRELPCEACHGQQTPKPNCDNCHRSPHDANLRKKCEDCHTAGLPFSDVKFRHPAKDLFALHQGIACVQCHEGKKFLKANRNCTACHTDYHKGSLGRDCYACHRSSSWNVTQFNHNQTGFPLMGTHRALECGDCHSDLQTFKIVPRPTECASCHEADYRSARFSHAAYGAGRNCQECHLQDTWVYAHSPYWFNIQTGRHAGIACTTCHKNAQDYREYSCHECHAGHSGDRNGRCLDCHPGGFPRGD